jgi:hypothetical protein
LEPGGFKLCANWIQPVLPHRALVHLEEHADDLGRPLGLHPVHEGAQRQADENAHATHALLVARGVAEAEVAARGKDDGEGRRRVGGGDALPQRQCCLRYGGGSEGSGGGGGGGGSGGGGAPGELERSGGLRPDA